MYCGVNNLQTVLQSEVPTHSIQPPPHRQLSRRHSDMPGRRQEESWQRRPRESFLNTESVDDDHEEYNEVARNMWRHNMERRRKAQSFRYPRLGGLGDSFSTWVTIGISLCLTFLVSQFVCFYFTSYSKGIIQFITPVDSW